MAMKTNRCFISEVVKMGIVVLVIWLAGSLRGSTGGSAPI